MMKRRLLADVHIDLRKFIIYNVIEFAFWFYLCFSYLIFLSHYNPEVSRLEEGAHIVSLFPSTFFMLKNWLSFFKNKSFRIYDTGIDFNKLGFWEWKDIDYKLKALKKHQFILNYTGRDLTKSQLKQAKHKYVDANGNKIILLMYGYPPFSASISNNAITSLIRKMVKHEKRELVPIQSAGHYATWAFISIVIGMIVFFSATGIETSDHVNTITCILLSAPILAYTYANKKIKKYKNQCLASMEIKNGSN